nr:MAG TPA: hypothetical protein [Caudoviricetes sp.]
MIYLVVIVLLIYSYQQTYLCRVLILQIVTLWI